jgi:hypothetical protein
MTIRTFQPGDDIAQVSVYNEAAAELTRFKPATVDEVRRRVRAADFDPGTRFYAVEGGQVVAYSTFQSSGRVSYPWCRKGREKWAEPLLDRVLEAMRKRGLKQAWAAYRGDWPAVRDFFLSHGFTQTREMLNFVLDLIEMPTPAARATTAITPLTPEDVRAFKGQLPDLFRAPAEVIEKSLLHNPYFPPQSVFCLRSRSDSTKPVAAGILVLNNAYADPKVVDSAMPCFRLGAFGTEGLTAKRINGLFSFVVTEPRETSALGLDLLGHAARLMQEVDGETVAGQVSSDVAHLVRFYKQNFRPQGSFPIFERAL